MPKYWRQAVYVEAERCEESDQMIEVVSLDGILASELFPEVGDWIVTETDGTVTIYKPGKFNLDFKIAERSRYG